MTISVSGVSKSFGDVVALSNVSFDVGEGLTALLGPNGAGKSTLIRLICGLTKPSSGSVTINGRSPRRDVSVFEDVGLVSQREELPERVTALDLVATAASMTSIGESDKRAVAALQRVELDPFDKRNLSAYSKGMRQRVKLATALVHEPKFIILDEPLNGMDPAQRIATIELFRQLADEGRTVLVSSHVLEEVERFGSRILMIGAGRLLAEGDFREIRNLLDDRPTQTYVASSDSNKLASALVAAGVATGARVEGTGIIVEAADYLGLAIALPKVGRKAKVRITEIRPLDDDLESVFRYLVAAQ